MRVQQQQRQVFLRRIVEGVKATRLRDGLAGEPPEQKAVVEGESNHRWRLSPHTVQGVEPSGCYHLTRGRHLVVPGWIGNVKGARRTGRQEEDVGKRGENVDQRITGEKRIVPLLNKEVGPGPPARDEIPLLVRVAATLAAHIEVELCAGLPRRLAEVAAAARAGLRGGAHAPVRGVDSGRPNRIVEELLA